MSTTVIIQIDPSSPVLSTETPQSGATIDHVEPRIVVLEVDSEGRLVDPTVDATGTPLSGSDVTFPATQAGLAAAHDHVSNVLAPAMPNAGADASLEDHVTTPVHVDANDSEPMTLDHPDVVAAQPPAPPESTPLVPPATPVGLPAGTPAQT